MGLGSWSAAVSPHRKWKSVKAAMEVTGVVARPPMPADRRASGRRVLVCALPVLFLVLPLPPVALAETSISIVTSNRSLTPSQNDYETGFVESLAPTGGIRVRVTTTAPAGLILSVSCSAGSPPIDMSHLLIRCPTVGSLIATYTAITSSGQALWAAGGPASSQDVDTDLKIINLWDYSDAGSAGTTNYTNTLIYTVVEQ
jgi:hypothetical protein